MMLMAIIWLRKYALSIFKILLKHFINLLKNFAPIKALLFFHFVCHVVFSVFDFLIPLTTEITHVLFNLSALFKFLK